MRPQKLTEENLAAVARIDSPILDALGEWANNRLTCSHCKRCTLRCEVLREPDLDIGAVEGDYRAIIALPLSEQPSATLAIVERRPELYHALRRCCFCGYCTATCQTHMLAPDRMRDWRELFMRAGLMPPDDSRLVMVDNEWHIFSAYRAIYGIGYPEFTTLAQAAEAGPGHVDTLFFPGCSLVSYAPELTRAAGEWLTRAGIAWALSDDCCGSPLMSAGLFDRAAALRQRILDQMRAAGITRMITICPGCADEFSELLAGEIEIVPLPEVLYGESRKMIARSGKKTTALEQGELNELAGFAPLETRSLTFFDSCHDRADSRHGKAIRALAKRYVPSSEQREMDHRKRGTLCCGAGGAVASFDPDITNRRVHRVIDEARATGAATLITTCPTCTYTVAQARLETPGGCGIENRHYLELLFGKEIPWADIFDQLGSMWTGEYGPWLNQTFFG